MLSFRDLEIKFGSAAAHQCLAEIERAARIPSWQMAEIDPETRLIRAIELQDISSCVSLAA